MRYIFLVWAVLVVIVWVAAGKQGSISRKPPIELIPDMDRQPKLRPQTDNRFFADGLSSRKPVAGTVSRGQRYENNSYNTGRIPGSTNFVESIPAEITEAMMRRGQERFGIYCTPCHGAQGDGKGITTKYGMPPVASLHDHKARNLIAAPDGYLFEVITNGKNLMGPYGPIIPIEDRWAIVAYVRALQRSQLATLDEIPADQRAGLKK